MTCFNKTLTQNTLPIIFLSSLIFPAPKTPSHHHLFSDIAPLFRGYQLEWQYRLVPGRIRMIRLYTQTSLFIIMGVRNTSIYAFYCTLV